MTNIIYALIALVLGTGVGYGVKSKILKSKGQDILTKSEALLKEAENKASKLVSEAKQKSQNLHDEIIREEKEKRAELKKLEDRLLKKEEELEDKIENSEKKKEDLEKRLQEIQAIKLELSKAHDKQEEELQKVASLSKKEAKEILFKKIEEIGRAHV
jgi:ribonuclease Y